MSTPPPSERMAGRIALGPALRQAGDLDRRGHRPRRKSRENQAICRVELSPYDGTRDAIRSECSPTVRQTSSHTRNRDREHSEPASFHQARPSTAVTQPGPLPAAGTMGGGGRLPRLRPPAPVPTPRTAGIRNRGAPPLFFHRCSRPVEQRSGDVGAVVGPCGAGPRFRRADNPPVRIRGRHPDGPPPAWPGDHKRHRVCRFR